MFTLEQNEVDTLAGPPVYINAYRRARMNYFTRRDGVWSMGYKLYLELDPGKNESHLVCQDDELRQT